MYHSFLDRLSPNSSAQAPVATPSANPTDQAPAPPSQLEANVDHDAAEKIARLNREWEERQRLHKEAELQHDRDMKEVRREQEERKETFRYKEWKCIDFGNMLKENFTQSFEEVKKANAARLAKSLALSQIDEDAHKLIQAAIKIRDPKEYTTEEEERAFQQLETKFFQQLALVESNNQSALVDQALNTLYGDEVMAVPNGEGGLVNNLF